MEYWSDKNTQDGFCRQCKGCLTEYWKSAKGREINKRATKKYAQSAKGILCSARFRASDKRKEYLKNYTQSGRLAIKEKERYHRIQDEYGWHSHIDSWYPAARFLEGLQTASVVEIKA